MPIVGESKKVGGNIFVDNKFNALAEEYLRTATNILTESQVDVFVEPAKTVMNTASNETLKDFFIENAIDETDPTVTPVEMEDRLNMLKEQYENDREAMLEYAPLNLYNPVVGMAFPLHKNLLMNCIFDKGAIPKAVAKTPQFTISMENRYLQKPDGTKIDIYKDQDKIMDAIEETAPTLDLEIKIPELGTTDILDKIGASSLDNLSSDCWIVALKTALKTPIKKGEKMPDGTIATDEAKEAWIPTRLQFTPNYGDDNRMTCMESVVLSDPHVDPDKNTDVISGLLQNNKFQINAMHGNVTAVKIRVRRETSNAMLQTCSVTWDTSTTFVKIPSAIPINTSVSPEEVKDIGALYNISQLSKIMSLFNIILENYKDDKIKNHLRESYVNMHPSQKKWGVFDFAPTENYMDSFVEWRKSTFMDLLDTHVTDLVQVLNDPNVTITVFGRPDIIRKITPTEYDWKSGSNIGPVNLEYRKVVKTSDNRVYQFISSQKLNKSNELIIILNPVNTNRIIYQIYDYQMYVSNEIRNAQNYALPAIHAFERWKFMEYQPVQGRLRILNPTGYREGKDIPTLGSVGSIGYQDNLIKTEDMKPTVPKGEQ